MHISPDKIETLQQIERRPFYKHLYFWVIVAIIAGALLGHYKPELSMHLKPLSTGFIKLVKMIITPVIFLTIVTGITGMSSLRGVGRVMGKAMTYFLFMSTLALVVGLVVANLVKPGAGLNYVPTEADQLAISSYVKSAENISLVKFLLDIIPETTMSAFSSGNILQVLFIAILFGFVLASAGEKAKPVVDFFNALTVPIFHMVRILMRAAPVGAFGAIAFTVADLGVESLKNMALLVGLFYFSSAVFILVLLGIVAQLCGFSILKLLRYIRQELLLVLGTSSSEPAMPGLMEKMEKAGCQKSVVGLVVPTGYSFNLDGTNLYMTLAALFIAQATNTDLSLQQQLGLLVIAMISSKGAAGVTGAGFVTLAATLQVSPTLPVAGMVLILGIDRFMSECRALTNFIGNAVATIVVARWEGALDRKKLREVLDSGVMPVDPVVSQAAVPADDAQPQLEAEGARSV